MNRMALDHRRTILEEAGTHFRATRITTVMLHQDLELDLRITWTAINRVGSVGRHVKIVLSTDHRHILVDLRTFRIDQEWDNNNRAAGGHDTLIIMIMVTVEFQGCPSRMVHKVHDLDRAPDRMVHHQGQWIPISLDHLQCSRVNLGQRIGLLGQISGECHQSVGINKVAGLLMLLKQMQIIRQQIPGTIVLI